MHHAHARQPVVYAAAACHDIGRGFPNSRSLHPRGRMSTFQVEHGRASPAEEEHGRDVDVASSRPVMVQGWRSRELFLGLTPEFLAIAVGEQLWIWRLALTRLAVGEQLWIWRLALTRHAVTRCITQLLNVCLNGPEHAPVYDWGCSVLCARCEDVPWNAD